MKLACVLTFVFTATSLPHTALGREPGPAKTVPARVTADFSGGWASAWLGGESPMRLQQQGDRVTGSYAHDGGRVEGTVVGDRLEYRWWQASGAKGGGWFRIAEDGATMAGPWWYDNGSGRVEGGTWEAWRTASPDVI